MKTLPQAVTLWIVGGMLLIAFIYAGCGRDAFKEAADRSEKAMLLVNEKKYAAALSLVNEAIALFADAKQDSALGDNYILAAICYRKLGEYDSALFYYQNADQSYHRLNDLKLERRGRIALAEFYNVIKDHHVALTLASDAVGSAKVFSDNADLYSSLRIAANANHWLGNYEEEVKLLNEFMQLDSSMYRSRSKPEYYRATIRAIAASRQYDKARLVWERWKNYGAAIKDSLILAQSFYTLGELQLTFNYPDSALRSFSQALGMISTQSERSLRIPLLSSLGNLAYRSQRFDNARFYYVDALTLAQQMNDVVSEQMLHVMILACDWKMSRSRSGISTSELTKRCSIIIAACHQTGFRLGEAIALFLQGRMTELTADPATASSSFRDALSIYDQLSEPMDHEDFPWSFVQVLMNTDKTGWHDPLLQYYCSQGKHNEAFDLIERNNLHDISRFFSNLRITTLDNHLRQAIEVFQKKYHVLQLLQEEIFDELAAGKSRNVERSDVLRKLFPRRLNDLAAAAKEIEKQSPNFARILLPQSIKIRQVQDTLSVGSFLVEYAPFANVLYILVATKDSSYIRKTSISDTHLFDLIQEYCQRISDPRINESSPHFNESVAISRINELSAVLASTLIEPIQSLIPSGSTMYIVPPKSFGWLPFHTLTINGNPIINRYHVSYLPTASALFFPQKRERYISDIIGIGHPGKTSWDVEYELKDIRGFYDNARMLFYSSASVSYLDTAKYQILHFASEFHLNHNLPDKSGATLSDGKTVYGLQNVSLGEMLKYPAPQALIFSNITTNPGELSRYAPLAFLANGTPTVIATMWQGERRGKKDFGEIFYTSIQTGISASQSYHNAMVTLAKNARSAQLHKWGLYFQFGR